MADAKRSAAAKKGWITRRANINKTEGESLVAAIKAATEANRAPDLDTAVVTAWFDDKGMNQIYSSGLEFAFVSPDGAQCHAFAFCKDYLQDAIWATLHNKTAQVYGFTYTAGSNPPLDMENCRIAVRLKGEPELRELSLKALEFIRALEQEMKFAPSQLQYGGKYKGGDDVFVFVGDKRWMYASTMLSLYTLALRVGMTYEEGPWREHFASAKKYLGSNDNSYTNSANKGLDRLLGKPVEQTFAAKFEDNYPLDVSIYGMHDSSGIVSFGDGNIDTKVKKSWQKSG